MNQYSGSAEAFITGYERLAAWAGVLDEINVFPVADGDTGRNLILSLAPLRGIQERDLSETRRLLLFAAKGNSGNIAARFITNLLEADSFDLLPDAAKAGAQNAWSAVHDPEPGTMLTVLDRFAEALGTTNTPDPPAYSLETMIDDIQTAVQETHDLLPALKAGGVVDAGALGMFLFLEGFLKSLSAVKIHFRNITEIFGSRLKIDAGFKQTQEQGHCVDMVLRLNGSKSSQPAEIADDESSLLLYTYQDYAKIHVHTNDLYNLKQRAESLGQIVQWSEDDISRQSENFGPSESGSPLHIVTDAAGSISRDLARRLGITLLESYVTFGETCAPETYVEPETVYHAMRAGISASTSQASVFERHQHYARLLAQYRHVLYLCVGSAYTGNFRVAEEWKKQHDTDNKLTIIDTGAASGKLAASAIATARYAACAQTPGQVIEFARKAVEKSKEYIFLEELKYLAAGGRMSKTGAFFGDMLHVKPVITPTANGAEKAGIVRNSKAQLDFAKNGLIRDLKDGPDSVVLIEYSDNRQWVKDLAEPEIRSLFPQSAIFLQPLSLTSGVHIGPGAWAVAYL